MVALFTSIKADVDLLPDYALLERLQLGDHQALLALYDRYSKYVYSIALRILKQSAAAEDVTQEVFLQIWVRPLQLEFLAGTMHGWLAVSSRNSAISLLRQRRDSLKDAVLALPNYLRKVVSKLNNEQQILLQMAFLEGWTHVEIAAATGYPLGTIKTRIRSALAEIRKSAAR